MYIGVDYYPEYWPDELIDEDIQSIASLGANMVRIGEFGWHKMESKDGQFDFSYYDDVIDRMKGSGLYIMFGTPTATFPAWLAAKHPEVLSQDIDGSVRSFGGRRQYCFQSDVYLAYSSRITKKLVQHFADEPSIVIWQIDNEFGHEGSDQCYCPRCHQAFRKFLSLKYEGDIDRLNEVYGTIFWGQTYNDFSEIPMPTRTITTHNPSLQLDWARFRSYSVNRFTSHMAEIVRKYKGDHQLVTHNYPGGFFEKWYDFSQNAEALDVVSYDNYPVWGGLAKPIAPEAIAAGHDFMRGLKGSHYWIAEELIGAQGHNMIGYLPRPEQAKMWSIQAFAHGCSNMLYFNWRAMTRGAEQFCMGILDHDNRRGQKYEEVRQTIAMVKPYAEHLQSSIESEIAVLYDYDNIWSWRYQQQSEAFDFSHELLRLYRPFYNLNCPIDIIPANRDFGRYKVLLIPVMQVIDQHLAKRLEAFAEAGGILIFSFRAGIRNRDNNLHFGMQAPGFISELTGTVVRGSEALPSGSAISIKPVCATDLVGGDNASYCEVWRDLLEPVTAESLWVYDEPMYPASAVTKNRFGKGQVYYIGGGMSEDVLDSITVSIVKEHHLWHIESDEGVEVCVRKCNETDIWFLMNHTEETKAFRGVRLGPFESKIIEGEPLT